MVSGILKKKRFLILLALLLAICLRWYVSDIYLFSPVLSTILFCLFMQFDDKHISILHSKQLVYEDLTDEKSKNVYLVFLRISMSISIVIVVDYIKLYYHIQPLYQTLGIIGGLYNLYKKVESRLAKVALLFTYYVIHKQKPYSQHNNNNEEDCQRIISVH